MASNNRGFTVKMPEFVMRENEIRKKNLRRAKDFRKRLWISQPTYDKIRRGERVDGSTVEKIKERYPQLKYSL